jgi:2-polyprenyl-3-methyl-5-hydroxy-6-metoxy-1,4-benzoquinol methylase
MPGDANERLKAFYDLRAAEEPATDPEALLRFDKALAAAGLRAGERVLDVGAKWGGLGARAREGGYEVAYTGLDLSEENARTAASLGLDVRQADVTQHLPVGDGEYDCVFCLELLEHVMSPISLLAEVRRVLKKDGRAVISVPSPYSWVEVYREIFHRHDPEGHLSSFTTPVMRNLAALAGFRLERTLGTSIRIPRTIRLISTDSILARSRIYVIRAADDVVFAGRRLSG